MEDTFSRLSLEGHGSAEGSRISLDISRISLDGSNESWSENAKQIQDYLLTNGLKSTLQPLDLSPIQPTEAQKGHAVSVLLENVAQQLSSAYEMLLGTQFLGQEAVLEGKQSVHGDIVGIVTDPGTSGTLLEQQLLSLNPDRNFEYIPNGKLVLVELKKPRSADKTIWTRLVGCSSALRTWLPPLREEDTLLVAICPVDQKTIWVYYDFLLFHNNGPVIMLKPDWAEMNEFDWTPVLQLTPVVPSAQDLLSFFSRVDGILSISASSIPGALLSLNGLDGTCPRIFIEKSALMTCVQYTLNKEGLHGYAYLSQVGNDQMYLSCRVINPYLMAKQAYMNDTNTVKCFNQAKEAGTRWFNDVTSGELICENCKLICKYDTHLPMIDDSAIPDRCQCGDGLLVCKNESCSLSHYLHSLGFLQKNQDDEEGDLDELIEDWETGVQILAANSLASLVLPGRKKDYITTGMKPVSGLTKEGLIGFFVFGITRELYLKYSTTKGFSHAQALFDVDLFLMFLDSCDQTKNLI